MNYSEYENSDDFEKNGSIIYKDLLGKVINKKNTHMAKVRYNPAHENNLYQEKDPRHGYGSDYATWIFCEEYDKKEGLLDNGLELLIDAFFEPNSSVGLHLHTNTDEIYYVISGDMIMTTITEDGESHDFEMNCGDAHVVKRGQSHYGVAGKDGCRCIVVGVRS